MNIDWDWIKQRPQFLAEELDKYFDMEVVSPINYRRYNLVTDYARTVKLKHWFQLPFGRFEFIRQVNQLLMKIYFKLFIHIGSYDIIWLSTPVYYPVIKNLISPNQKVIYDCMDDNASFPGMPGISEYCRFEKALMQRADHVFFSAAFLRDTILQRYEFTKNINSTIVNNALSFEPKIYEKENKAFNDGKFHITYIGTVASWFDFNLLNKSLEKFSNIQYELYGPVDKDINYKNSRVIFHGPISHSQVIKVMQQADALVMPFQLIPLVLSVNPVKLYEYISSMKPTICVSYKEADVFQDFVYLYHDDDEYLSFIDLLSKGNLKFKKTREDVNKFLNENTWENRGKTIQAILEKL